MQREKEEHLNITESGTELLSDADAPNEDQIAKCGKEALPTFDERFETLSLIGEGGMGSVYKVRDKTLNSVFAIKLLKAELATEKASVKRFEKEAEATIKMTHENLVTVYSHGCNCDGIPFIVMELVGDRNLGQVIKAEGHLPADKAIYVFRQICDALIYAHKAGIVHRDLKPSNIILAERSAEKSDREYTVKVADFGIASIAKETSEGGETLTKTGDIVGSPLYMSPEQCVGQPIDARSDIYSLGCVMYSTLTGKPPFEGANPVQIILKHLNENAPRLPKHIQMGQAADLESVILKCMEKDREDRYKSAEEVKSDLEKVARGRPIRYIPNKRKWKRRKRMVSFAVAMFALLLCASVSLYKYVHGTNVPPDFGDIADSLDEGKALQHFQEGHYEQAIPLLQYLSATARRKHKPYQEAFLYQCLGQCYLALKNYSGAEQYYIKSLSMTQSLIERDKLTQAQTTGMLTEAKTGYIAVLRALGRPAEALKILKTLDVRNLERLEDFYSKNHVTDDLKRVRSLREELQQLQH